MKRRLICIGIVLCLTFTLCSCRRGDGEEELYRHFSKREESFFVWTRDIDTAFEKMFASHPEQLVYFQSVSSKVNLMGTELVMKYTNTEIPTESISCGAGEETVSAALHKSLAAVQTSGMMVLTDGNVEEDTLSKTIESLPYTVTMGLESSKWQFITNKLSDAVLVQYTLKYYEKSEDVLAKRQEVENEVALLAKKLWSDDTPAIERVRRIHDHIINHTAYNLKEENVMIDHTPYGPLIRGKGVCDGYTRTVQLLLDAAGVENIFIEGRASGEDHSWNMVKLDGSYYHLDVTWDDPIDYSGKQHLEYDYFLKGDSALLVDHLWDRDAYPTCPKNYQ